MLSWSTHRALQTLVQNLQPEHDRALGVLTSQSIADNTLQLTLELSQQAFYVMKTGDVGSGFELGVHTRRDDQQAYDIIRITLTDLTTGESRALEQDPISGHFVRTTPIPNISQELVRTAGIECGQWMPTGSEAPAGHLLEGLASRTPLPEYGFLHMLRVRDRKGLVPSGHSVANVTCAPDETAIRGVASAHYPATLNSASQQPCIRETISTLRSVGFNSSHLNSIEARADSYDTLSMLLVHGPQLFAAGFNWYLQGGVAARENGNELLRLLLKHHLLFQAACIAPGEQAAIVISEDGVQSLKALANHHLALYDAGFSSDQLVRLALRTKGGEAIETLQRTVVGLKEAGLEIYNLLNVAMDEDGVDKLHQLAAVYAVTQSNDGLAMTVPHKTSQL